MMSLHSASIASCGLSSIPSGQSESSNSPSSSLGRHLYHSSGAHLSTRNGQLRRSGAGVRAKPSIAQRTRLRVVSEAGEESEKRSPSNEGATTGGKWETDADAPGTPGKGEEAEGESSQALSAMSGDDVDGMGTVRSSSSSGKEEVSGSQSLTLEDVNPVGLGRRSRQFVDEVWRRILQLGQLARPPAAAEEEEALIEGPNCEFTTPNAQFTKVLVVGPTGRVGRVLVRKLLLRGYTVRVLVRQASFAVMEQLPGAVEVMEADLEADVSNTVLMQAVRGCQKIIYCAAARNPNPEALAAVDTAGVVKLSKALLDYNHQLAQKRAGRSSKSKVVVVKFNKERYQQGWRLREGRSFGFGGGAAKAAAAAAESEKGGVAVAALGADAEFEITDTGHGLFQGTVVERGAYVEVKRVLEMPEGLSLGRFEGLVVRVIGDSRPYSLVLETSVPQHQQPMGGLHHSAGSGSTPSGNSSTGSSSTMEDSWNTTTTEWALMEDDEDEDVAMEGMNMNGRASSRQSASVVSSAKSSNGAVRRQTEPCQYVARFNTRRGPSTIRIPFSAFRPAEVGYPPLNPADVTGFAIRFEQRRPKSQPAAGASADPYGFRLELDFIKAFPSGDETDFILVSCTGAAVPEDAREAVIKAKQAAESQLRNSGLGYTIVRPGPLFEEPGGRKALVFDQGNRISQGISCADVADVCVKALHDPLARNKSFDICYEYSDGSGLYELVAHLPDKANNYLTPALALLEKNT